MSARCRDPKYSSSCIARIMGAPLRSSVSAERIGETALLAIRFTSREERPVASITKHK